MRGGVMAHGVLADVGVHDSVNAIAYYDVLLGLHPVRAHSLDGRIAADYFRDDDVAAG